MPAGSGTATLVYQLSAAAAAAVLAVSIARLPVSNRRMWWCVLGYVVLSQLGDVVYSLEPLVDGERPYPGVADLVYGAAYACAFGALAQLIRRVSTGRDAEAWIDTVVFGLVAASVVALLVVEPTLAAGDSGGVALAVTVAYPMIDVILLAGLVRVIVSAGGRQLDQGVWLLSAAFIVTFAADLYYAFASATGSDGLTPSWLDSLYLLAFMIMAVAANIHDAHSPDVPVESSDSRRMPSTARMLVFALATITVPVVLVLTSGREGGRQDVFLSAGLVAIVLLIQWRVLRVMRTARRQSAALRVTDLTDSLTGLPNRLSFNVDLESIDASAVARQASFVVALVDLDYFRLFNEQRGHQAGDEALRASAMAWRLAVTSPNSVARYGGDEFAVLLPGVTIAAAREILVALRDATPSGHTCSIGFADRWPGESAFDTLRRAGRALYRAKDDGRNCIVADRLAQARVASGAES